MLESKLNALKQEVLEKVDQLEDKSGSIWDKLKKAFK